MAGFKTILKVYFHAKNSVLWMRVMQCLNVLHGVFIIVIKSCDVIVFL